VFQEIALFLPCRIVVGVECLPIFQQSVSAVLYEWLLKEQKKCRASSIEDVIRQILWEATAKAKKHENRLCPAFPTHNHTPHK